MTMWVVEFHDYNNSGTWAVFPDEDGAQRACKVLNSKHLGYEFRVSGPFTVGEWRKSHA